MGVSPCTARRGRKHWESEALCLGCLAFSHRAYRDPDFMSPEEHTKRQWGGALLQQ